MDHSSQAGKKKERKKGGLWGRLAGGGSSVIKVGAPKIGGAAGLLATKAGLVALLVIGTTVAGGLGVVGYRFLGGETAQTPERFNSIFQPRPKQELASAQDGAYPAAKDGSSSSLQFLADANRGAGAPEVSSAEPQFSSKEAQAAHAAGVAGAPQPGGGGASVVAAAHEAGKPFAPPHKIGELSKSFGGGAGPSNMGAVAAGAASGAVSLSAGPRRGLGGMGTNAARPGVGSQRALAFNRDSGAGRQLMSVRRDHVSAGSSAQSGRTYDGGAGRVGSNFAGEEATGDGGISSGKDGGKDKAPGATPGAAARDALEKPLTVDGSPMTPWQDGIDAAKYLIMGALAMLFLASKVIDMAAAASVAQPYSQIAVRAWLVLGATLLGLAAAAGLAAMSIGTIMMTGQYKQMSAGLPLALGGAAVAAAAGFALQSVLSDEATGAAWNSETAAKTKIDPISGGSTVLMYVCGGAAAVALAVTMLMKPDKLKPGEPGYDPKDGHGWGMIEPMPEPPSRGLLERFLV